MAGALEGSYLEICHRVGDGGLKLSRAGHGEDAGVAEVSEIGSHLLRTWGLDGGRWRGRRGDLGGRTVVGFDFIFRLLRNFIDLPNA